MGKISLIIIGATGIVGQEILSILSNEPFQGGQLQLSASDDSVGEFYNFAGSELEIVSPEKLNLDSPALVVLCTPRDISENLLATLKEKNLAIVDCSGLERESNKLALMPEAITGSFKSGAYSVKSSAGFIISSFLAALDLSENISSLTATIHEPVSGAGRAGLDELWNQTRAIFSQTPIDPEYFPEQIAFNLLSQVDVMREDGSTAYEYRVQQELAAAKITPLRISTTTLRVPVMYGCGVSLSFETTKKISAEDITKKISKSARFALDQEAEHSPSTMSVIGDDQIHLGRLRVLDLPNEQGTLVNCWLVADNIKACLARPVIDLYRSLMPLLSGRKVE